jgi:hypothetical protein
VADESLVPAGRWLKGQKVCGGGGRRRGTQCGIGWRDCLPLLNEPSIPLRVVCNRWCTVPPALQLPEALAGRLGGRS